MFDKTLGKYTGSDNTIELKEDAKPFYAKPISIPINHKLTLNKLIKIRVLK